jgi:AcrR family transcriptional regulator
MKTRNTAIPTGRRETQRERLLAGVVAVANRDGYTATNVSAVIAQAGVSRPTFYEYFAGTEDCFLATLTDANKRLLAAVRDAVGEAQDGADDARGGSALRAVFAALVDFARAQPELARFAMSESLGGGAKALAARDDTIGEIAELVERTEASAGAEAATPDLPLWLALGTTCRLLASRLRRGLPISSALQEELLAWIESYARPAGELRWRDSPLGAAPGLSPYVPDSPMRPPQALGRGRPKISEEEVAENHRQRLLFAAAALAGERGYAATTIAEIAKRASLDRRVFYTHFKDKQHIYAAVYDFGFQRLLAVTAGAFFAGGGWPERVWEGTRGLAQFLESNPALASVGFVEVYAIGPSAVQRIEDGVSAFTVFLQEGYQYEPRAGTPPRLAVAAIATSFVEVIYHQARASRAQAGARESPAGAGAGREQADTSDAPAPASRPQMRGLVGLLTFVCLAPFIGEGPAAEFIASRLAAESAGAS